MEEPIVKLLTRSYGDWRLYRVGDWSQVWSMEIVFIEGGVRLIDVGFYQRIEEGDNELGNRDCKWESRDKIILGK